MGITGMMILSIKNLDYGIDVDEETIDEEFFELLYEGYLVENVSGFILTSTGKRAAKKVFQAMSMLDSAHVESSRKRTSQNREELEGRRLAAVKYVQKKPKAALADVERKYNLGEKTLSRSPYKEMIAAFTSKRDCARNIGRKTSYRGKHEKQPRTSAKFVPDHRRSHIEEADERLDGATDT